VLWWAQVRDGSRIKEEGNMCDLVGCDKPAVGLYVFRLSQEMRRTVLLCKDCRKAARKSGRLGRKLGPK